MKMSKKVILKKDRTNMAKFASMSKIILFILAAIMLSCSHQSDQKSVIISSELPQYAKGFKINLLADSSYQIILLNPESVTDTVEIIHVPKVLLENISCLSTTHVAMIDQLDRLDHLKGISFADRVKNLNAQSAFQRGEIINLSTDRDLDDEILIGLKTNLLFVYPFGGEDYSKFTKSEILVVPISEYMEGHPLGRAEWIKVFGLLLGEKEKADQLFEDLKNRYLALANLVNKNTKNRPSVFTGFYDNGDWYAPAGNGFVAQFLKDAGSNYIFADSLHSGNLKIPFELLYEKVYETDTWIKIFYSTTTPSREQITGEDSRLIKIKSFREGNIFYCNTADNDYFGDAIMEPEVLLADLINCFHPELLTGRKNKYYKKINSI